MRRLVMRLPVMSLAVLGMLMVSASSSYAGVGDCQQAPADKLTLDCQELRAAVLQAIRQKHQRVSLASGGGNEDGEHKTQQLSDANLTYKAFLQWTADRDSVTIANLLSESDPSLYDPNSFKAAGYAVMWLNIPAVNAGKYYDQFLAQRNGQAMVTYYDTKGSTSLASRNWK